MLCGTCCSLSRCEKETLKNIFIKMFQKSREQTYSLLPDIWMLNLQLVPVCEVTAAPSWCSAARSANGLITAPNNRRPASEAVFDMKTRPAGIGNVNADWMGSLPAKLSAMPLKYLAVPGSHDSFTYWVDVHAPVGPDQKAYVKYLATAFSVVAKKVMVKWSMTQNLTFREQLDAGIRYFDLRVSSKPGESGTEIYFIHGLFGHKVKDGLLEIHSFLCRHRKEVVFLDFNHYYAMNAEHHVYLITMLQEVFGSKLCNNSAVESITLDYLWEKKYQVIVFYHHPSAQGIPVMWPGNKIPAPWANTTEPNKLVQFLETTLKERAKQGSFHVSQAILTPRVNTVAKGLVWGLRNYLVERNLPTIISWVEAQKPGVDGVNIITSDFVELTDFANIVIRLNNQLLSEQDRKSR